MEADGGSPVIEGNCFRRLKRSSRQSYIKLAQLSLLSEFKYTQLKITSVTLSRQRIEIH
jgi:hypothetical protein